jgi:hypothetical protein
VESSNSTASALASLCEIDSQITLSRSLGGVISLIDNAENRFSYNLVRHVAASRGFAQTF